MGMKKGMAVAAGVLFAFTFVATVFAQAPSGPPKPGPEQQKLAYFAGKWTSEGETKPNSFGPAGKLSYTQTCEWFSGGFALVCHTDTTTVAGSVSDLNSMADDIVEETYGYFEA